MNNPSIKGWASALAALSLLSACHDINDAPPEIKPQLELMAARDAAMTDSGEKSYKTLMRSSSDLAAFLSNTTVRNYDLLHGTQIEYLGADGTAVLWYPGNSGAVIGRWQTRKALDGADMCFLYGASTYNPVTNESGGNWECGDASLYLIGVDEVVSGDIFGLGKGRVPFRLGKEATTLKALAAQAGARTPGANKVNW